MNDLLSFLAEHAVLVLALACIPYSGFFLWKTRDILGLSGVKMASAPFIYVAVGLLSIVVFSLIHDLQHLSTWSLHHQGILIVFPLFFPLAAKLLGKDLRDVSDALMVSIPGIIAGLRSFCLLRGCHFGLIIPGTSIHFPLREMVMVVNLCVSFFLLHWIRRPHIKGIFLPGYLIFYGLFRLLEVALRYDPQWQSNSGDRFFAFVSIALGVFLGILILQLQENDRTGKGKRKGSRS